MWRSVNSVPQFKYARASCVTQQKKLPADMIMLKNNVVRSWY